MANRKKRRQQPMERGPTAKPAPRRRIRRRATWPYWVGGSVVALSIAGVAVIALANSAGSSHPTPTASPPRAPGAPIDGIKCENEMVQTHFHAHLTLLQDGNGVPLPAGIGISQEARCLYWLHTHQTDGIIHVESPGPAAFTVGQFFDIWGQPLTSSQAGPIAALAGQRLHVYVDGQSFTGDPRSIQLRAHQVLVLEAGRELPPPGYTFAEGL